MSKTQQDARDQYTRILTSVPMVPTAPGARDSHLHVVKRRQRWRHLAGADISFHLKGNVCR